MSSKKKTRIASRETFGGCACELPESDLPTNSDVACYFYFVSLTETDYISQLQLVQEKLVSIWYKMNSRLPLLGKKNLYNKLTFFLDRVKEFNKKRLKAAASKLLLLNKDRLFDISACTCDLPTVSCNAQTIRCVEENCDVEHIACDCPLPSRVPVEERLYMRDQRRKSGTRGSFQLGPVDRQALSMEKALEAARQRKLSKPPRKTGQRLQQVIANTSFEVCKKFCILDFF